MPADQVERLELAIEAAARVIARSPRKAVYEMAWDLAEAAVKAADPILRKQRDEELRKRLESVKAETYTDLARRFGLSPQGIVDIVGEVLKAASVFEGSTGE